MCPKELLKVSVPFPAFRIGSLGLPILVIMLGESQSPFRPFGLAAVLHLVPAGQARSLSPLSGLSDWQQYYTLCLRAKPEVSVPFPAYRIGSRSSPSRLTPARRESQSPFRPFGLAVDYRYSFPTDRESLSPLSGLSDWQATNFSTPFTTMESLSPLSGLSDWQESDGDPGMAGSFESLSPLSGLSDWQEEEEWYRSGRRLRSLSPLSGLSDWQRVPTTREARPREVSVPFPAFRIGSVLLFTRSPESFKSQSPFRPFGLAVR